MLLKCIYWFPMVVFVVLGCKDERFEIIELDNVEFRENTVFNSYEDLTQPKFQNLIDKYQLDTIFEGGEDEFLRILMIKEWIHQTISIDNDGDPYPGNGYVEGILDAALEGVGFHCGHFMKVQNAIFNAYGYVSRPLGTGPGVSGVIDQHHGINETWVNSMGKWVLLDAKYNHYFEKNGIPLSVLEVRDEYLKNKAADIDLIKGIDRVKMDYDPEFERSKESFARTYTWVEYHINNNMFLSWPYFDSKLIVYEDDYFDNHVWMWEDHPHWAYNQPEFMVREKNRNAIEWTPNTIASKVFIKDNIAKIKLHSNTPNFKSYQIKVDSISQWMNVVSEVNIDLTKSEFDVSFRTLNLANVSGPVHRLIKRSKD